MDGELGTREWDEQVRNRLTGSSPLGIIAYIQHTFNLQGT